MNTFNAPSPSVTSSLSSRAQYAQLYASSVILAAFAYRQDVYEPFRTGRLQPRDHHALRRAGDKITQEVISILNQTSTDAYCSAKYAEVVPALQGLEGRLEALATDLSRGETGPVAQIEATLVRLASNAEPTAEDPFTVHDEPTSPFSS